MRYSIKSLMTLSALLLVSGCVSTPHEVVRETVYIERDIPIQARPAPVNLSNVRWRVVNASNINEFAREFEINPTTTFVVTTREGYQNIIVNMAELRRYIRQQDELLVYYESAILGDDS
jgi:hypothetical protein